MTTDDTYLPRPSENLQDGIEAGKLRSCRSRGTLHMTTEPLRNFTGARKRCFSNVLGPQWITSDHMAQK